MTKQTGYEISVGQKIASLLNLKVNKTTGLIDTSIGKKTIQGLGIYLIGIIEEENNHLRINAILDELKANYDMGFYTSDEYKTKVTAVK